MPDNPLKNDAGNKARALQLLEYFNSRSNQIELNFISEHYWGQWQTSDIEKFEKTFPNFKLDVLSRKISKKNKLKYFFKYKLPNALRKNNWLVKTPALPNNNTIQLQKSFNLILKQNVFDYIIISYVTWATLVRNNSHLNNAVLINDTHDFITAQNKLKSNFRLGSSFEEELKLLSIFDEIWSVSIDEQYLFSQFLSGKNRFVPISYKPQYEGGLKTVIKEFDLLYIGSENENNVKSLNWFFSEVYSLLSEDLTICVIGKIGDFIPSFSNVKKIHHVEDLTHYYNVSKVALCPMLTGTGIKVKVVEAMSFGLPIVCSQRGLDGLPNKENNGCLLGDSNQDFALHIRNLLENPAYYKTIQQLSIKTFIENFSQNKYYDKLDNIFSINQLSE